MARAIVEGHGYHTVTVKDLKAEKALSEATERLGFPKRGGDHTLKTHLFRGLCLQEHLHGAEDALSRGKLDVFKVHIQRAKALV